MHPTLRSLALPVASVLALLAAGTSVAHEDDGKVRDKQRAVFGKAWRADIEGAKGQDGGVAGGGFGSQGVALRSWFPLNTIDAAATSGNDCWGYVAPNGREFALIGVNNGTGVFDVSNPSAAAKVGFIPGPNSLWRDIKVFGQYAYVVSEGGGGIQVLDLTQLGSGVVTLANTVTTGGTLATHNVAINTQSGYLYRCGGGSTGLRMYLLNGVPVSPQFVGEWSAYYVHDAQIVSYTTGPYAGKEIAFCCGGLNGGNAETGLYIVDVTNKSAPTLISRILYPTARYSHQGWLTEDRKYFLLGDELDEGASQPFTTTHVIDVQNLSAPSYVGQFGNQTPAITHNAYTHQGKMFAANYRSGLRVFDVSTVQNLSTATEVAFFDTYPADDGAQFNGLWSCYPYFPSGTVIGSDLERGLFVWRLAPPVASFSVATTPALVNPAGGTTVDVTITPGTGQTLNQSSAIMKVTVGGTTTNVPLSPLGGNNYRATFPATPCTSNVSYQFQVSNTAGDSISDSLRSAFSAISVTTALNDAFETATGWTGGVAGDTATSGQWVRVDPVATTAQPEDDHTPAPGVLCWITGNGAVGGAAGAADVDGGVTTLLSPVFDMSAMDEPTVEAWVWYSNNLGGAPNEDSMPIEISNNGGTSWTLIENYATNAGAWTKKSWRVRDYITPTASVRMRFIARDLGTGSLVEAGLDDFKIIDVDCTASIPGDLNGDGVVNGADLAILLGAWGGSGLGDINGDGSVNATDLSLLLGAWG